MRYKVLVREVRFKETEVDVDDEDTITEAAAELPDDCFDDVGGSWDVIDYKLVDGGGS